MPPRKRLFERISRGYDDGIQKSYTLVYTNFDGECFEFVRTTEISSGIANTRFRRDDSDGRGDNDGWTGSGS
jgi:hypothetical protein